MRLQDDIDFTTLNWVKQDLDETLKQARQALEAYVENPTDASLMRSCVIHLHQVQGTLRMVELYGAAMVVEEMERVTSALLDGQIKPQEETYSVLMRGIVQLPDYLERLQSGHKDIPIVLLPLLNDLRATRGETLLTESVLFSPDLSAPLPIAAAGATTALSELELKSLAARLRTAFQLALLRWIRDESAHEHLERLINVLDRLRESCMQENARRLWWVATGVLEGVVSGALEASVTIKLLFGKVDREIKRLVDAGEANFAVLPPRELTKNLLYYIAHSTTGGPRAADVMRTYKLDTLLPSEKELAHAKGSISGHNRTLLDTVSAAIKEDLLRVKEALDIFLRAQGNDPSELMTQADVLDRVGDTLGMLGLGVPRRVVVEQRQIIEEIANKTRAPDESTLLDVAGALLFVEASLDDHIERLGAETPEVKDRSPLELPKAEVRKILDALMQEAAVNLAQAKQDIIAFIESPWDHARVEQVPRLLEEVSGAMRMLDLTWPAQLMTGIVRFVEIELLRYRRVPTAEQLDKLADALASIEYYMEATREQRGGREKILSVTRKSLESLGYWPVPEDENGGDPPPSGTPTPDRPSSTRNPEIPTSTLVPHTTRATRDANAQAATPVSALDISNVQEYASEFPRWGEHLPASGEAGLKLDAETAHANDAQELPSIDLPSDHSFDAVLPLDQNTTAPAMPASVIDTASSMDLELHSAIDISPGPGLEDLVIGEATSHEPLVHDIGGLHLTETESITTRTSGTRSEKMADSVAPLVDASFQVTPSDDIDEEIREVFVEEVQEEIDNLNRNLPVWKSDIHDFEKLKLIRRSFHTLKGSGRLVGALALGEFSWRVESLLNRVLDRTLAPSQAILALVDHAIGTLPRLLMALRGDGESTADIAGIMAVADRLASGEEAWLREPVPVHTQKVENIADPQVPEPDTVVATPITSMTSAASTELLEAFDLGIDLAIPTVELTADADAHNVEQVTHATAPLPNIDPLLFDILKSEVATHLGVFDTYLAQAQKQPIPISEPLLRAVHTLNGAIAMVDIPVISHVLAPLEGYVKRLRGRMQAPDAEGIQALADAAQLVQTVMQALEIPPTPLPDSDALAARIVQLRDTLPEPELMHTLFTLTEDEAQENAHAFASEPAGIEFTSSSTLAHETPSLTSNEDLTAAWVEELEQQKTVEHVSPANQELISAAAESITLESKLDAQPPVRASSALPVTQFELPPLSDDPQPNGKLELPDLDEDLLEIFVQEGADILDHSDSLMARLRDAPQDHDLVSGLQRDLHTLKGGARMAGLAPIGDLSHSMESLLEAISENRRLMDRAIVESLERGFDRLHGLVQRIAKRQAIAMPEHAIARFEALVSGELPVNQTLIKQAPATAAESAPPATPAPPVAAAAKPARPAPRPLPALEEEDTTRVPQEMIRVRSDLLDSLVNYAGEVSIYRSRLEQQISTFRFNLVEFEQTVSRLREQLRKLEMETEAQILSRYQREAESGDSAFDPLELDRFSQLQQLSRALAESVSDLVSIQGLLDDLTRQSETLLLQQSRVSSDLQEGLMRTRMVPFDSLVPSLRRTLRQAAQEVGKRAQLKVEGAQGEMDRNLLERMKAPFEHMLRNALAHGIETQEERVAVGKAAEGTVTIQVSREATEVVLRVSDDGQGMDRDAIRRKAIERGLLKPDAQLSDRDLYGFILETGFSTVETVTQLAGRGVGMDVVHNEIKQLGGSLAIDSTRGKGTTFVIRLPFTLAVTQAILVRLGEAAYAIPMSSVQGVVRITRADLERRISRADASYTYAGEEFLIYELAQLLNVPAARISDETQLPLLMIRTGDQRAAVRIDGVIGSREIVVKSVGPQISSVPGIFGATIMGDGSVVMILDLAPLVRRSVALRERVEAGEIPELPIDVVVPPLPTRRHQPLVMVVDDSITMRKVTTRVLERNDMDVITAKDGLDAVEKLQEKIPDVVLLDVEMPRMDGYELATYMKNDARLKRVPIIMVTSRTGEKHRQRALEIGVERYIGKPYQEADLLRNVQETLKVSRV